jgi:exopolysaccharide biosynthesis polyprenyl glycosylphosphotransferase
MFASRSSSVPHNKSMVAAADAAGVVSAFLFAVLLRFGWSEGQAYAIERGTEVIAVAVIFPIVFYVVGLYDTSRLRSAVASVMPAAFAVSVGVLLGGACVYATWSRPLGRGVAATFALALFTLLVLFRWAYALASRRGVLSARCVVIGTRDQASRVVEIVRSHPDSGLRLVGLVHGVDGPDALPSRSAPDELPALGSLGELDEIVSAHHVDRVIIATRVDDDPALLRQLRPLRYKGVALMDVVSIYEELAREIPLDHIDERWLLNAALTNSRLHIRRLKRVTDVLGSLLLLVPAIPLMAIAALATKLSSRGPVLFRQERVGLGSKPFMVLKLRTMYEDAEKLTGPVWSSDNDPRITPVGRILRKFRIDELPQLFNVLAGDMSLVGPRPERPVFVQRLCEATPFYSERMHVRPGITGWAQVMAPYASTVGDSIRKLQFDLYYEKHMSLTLDFVILVKTVKTMLFGRERSQGGLAAGRQLEALPEPMRIARRSGT